MSRPRDSLPAPPELPSFRVEDESPEISAPEERHTGTGLVRHPVSLREDAIDMDAARVVRRLERSGFQAYLVGGCVRDLLLRRKPKDFDIATNARPEEVRRLFRNCRVIGRRFLLAHVLFGGGKVIEVATFRRNPQSGSLEFDPDDEFDDLLIRNDNAFGEAHEDALRRDFTINALFYDLDRAEVLDWCGGMGDIQRRTIHTIGDPVTRFREDPVRMLRAIKFSARLDLGIGADVYDAMVASRDQLARAARRRLFEEILRLLRGGAAHRSMWLLWETGAMAVLLPELAAFLDDEEANPEGAARFWRTMQAIDRHTREHGATYGDLVLWCALLREPLLEACAGHRDFFGTAAEFLEPVIERVAIPRRVADAIRGVLAMQSRLRDGRLGRAVRSELATAALDVLELECVVLGEGTSLVRQLRAELAHAPAARRPRARE